jgi:hypothetical protein
VRTIEATMEITIIARHPQAPPSGRTSQFPSFIRDPFILPTQPAGGLAPRGGEPAAHRIQGNPASPTGGRAVCPQGLGFPPWSPISP